MEIIKVVSKALGMEAKMNSAIGHASESQEKFKDWVQKPSFAVRSSAYEGSRPAPALPVWI